MTSATLLVSPLASRIRDVAVRRRITRAATAAMEARGATEVEVHEAGDPASIRAAAADAVARGSQLVVIAGGDGTVRDASGPLTGTGIQVGIVPCGTGNLYATAIGVPRNLDAAVDAIATGTPAPRDIGSVRLVPPAPGDPVTETPFGVACGTGFDARLIAATSPEAKRRYGIAAYFLAASRLLGDLAPRPTVLEVDGRRQELESVVVLVANTGEVIPGRVRPRLPIEPDDGLLHVFVLPRGGLVHSLLGAVELMLAETAGASASGAGLRLTGTDVRVKTEPAGPVQVDGDVIGTASIEARVRAGGLVVLCPSRSPAGPVSTSGVEAQRYAP